MDRYGEIYTTYRLIMEGAAALKQLFCAMVIRQFLIQRNCKSSQILWI